MSSRLAKERKVVLSALADGVGALAATNRRLRGEPAADAAVSNVLPFPPPTLRPKADGGQALADLIGRLDGDSQAREARADLRIPAWSLDPLC